MESRRAAVVLAVGAAIGLLVQLLFFAVPLGINLVVLIGALLAAGWLVRGAGARLDPVDAWLPVGAMALAAFVAVRTDPVLVMLDTFGSEPVEVPEAVVNFVLRRAYVSAFMRSAEVFLGSLVRSYLDAFVYYLGLRPGPAREGYGGGI